MVNCLFCHNPVTENQVLCLNCGSQIKPLEVRHRYFWRKCNVLLSDPSVVDVLLEERKKMDVEVG